MMIGYGSFHRMAFQFIIGVNIMKIRLLIITILLFSCFNNNKKSKIIRDKSINLSIQQIYKYNEDSFDVSIDYDISNNHFVFVRNADSFEAAILTTIQVYDIIKDSIIIQTSWKDSIIEEYFDKTRSKKKAYTFKKELSLIVGEYYIRINIEDLDNHNIYKAEKKILLSKSNGFGELIMYSSADNINDDTMLKEINNKIKTDKHNIRLYFQYFQNQKSIDKLVLEYNDSDTKYTEEYIDLLMDEDGFYSIDFEIPSNFYGNLELIFSISDNSIIKNIDIRYPNNNYWTNDINEILGVMRYILPAAEIKSLKEMNSEEKIEYINKYWEEKDPSSDTKKNELLEELTERVNHANLNFSDINKGWRSDRGRIYIIYGLPDRVERYSSQSDGLYEIWEYPSGNKFIFLDRNGFGNFILVKQTF